MSIERASETPITLEGLTLGDAYVAVGALSALAEILERQGYKDTIGLSAVRELKEKLQAATVEGTLAASLDANQVLDALDEVFNFADILRLKDN